MPVGSQAKFIEAAKCAAVCGFPINTLLTVRWVSLYHHDNANPLFAQSPVERIAYLVELLRKWVGTRCRGGFLYLWVRETTSELGEHWHLAFHLPHGKRKAVASYLSDLLGEPVDHTPAPRLKGEQKASSHVASGGRGTWQKTHTRNDPVSTSPLILGRANHLNACFAANWSRTPASWSGARHSVAVKGLADTTRRKVRSGARQHSRNGSTLPVRSNRP
ncbi:hypothetical protein [Shimia sp. W99]